MKRIWVALVLLIICSTFAFAEFIIVHSKSSELYDSVVNAETHFLNKEYKTSFDILNDAVEKWENSEKILNVFLSHEKVDEIEERLCELSKYAENKDKALFYATLEKTKRQLLCLKQSELPSLKNIM